MMLTKSLAFLQRISMHLTLSGRTIDPWPLGEFLKHELAAHASSITMSLPASLVYQRVPS